MPLVTTKKMFDEAFKGGYAIGAFNINNMEIVQAIVDGAKEKNSPVILQVSSSAINYIRPAYLMHIINAAVEESGVDIALHLDHGADFEACKAAVDMGFTSVMIDGSHFELAKNIEVTKKVVDYAHSRGVVVEAELGKLAGIEDAVKVNAKDATYTDPDEAVEFVKATGVDSLAIAIGTSHGAYKFKGDANLDFDRLETITNKLDENGFHNFPIVLHGASAVDPKYVEMCNVYGGELSGAKGVPSEMLRKASSMSVCKINMDTDLRLAMTGSVRKVLSEKPKEIDPRKYLGVGRDNIKDLVIDKIENILGSKDTSK